MKATARPIISRFGFKQVLIFIALLVAVLSGCYGLFRADTPHWILLATLLATGFFRSLQFTALNALGFSEVPQPLMSRASSLSSMFQQLAQSLGVGLAALLIHYTLIFRRSPRIGAADISPAFVIISVLSLAALYFYAALPADAGSEVSGRPGKAAAGAAEAQA